MHNVTEITIDDRLETPVMLLDFQADVQSNWDSISQGEARRTYEYPGVIIVDNVASGSELEGLREGITGRRRSFKERFNYGVPDSKTFLYSLSKVRERVRGLTEMLFGYDLPAKSSRSYRPLITEGEPLHFDTFNIDCGTTALMALLNFDVEPRRWRIGYSFREMCRQHGPQVEQLLAGLRPDESPSSPLRAATISGSGPLGPGAPVHHINFAPGTVWFANPKVLSHEVVYGSGAYLETWFIKEPPCTCQLCVMRENGILGPDSVKHDAPH